MAEVVGVVSAGIGIAAFALQVKGTIERLRDSREYNKSKAGDELESLVRRLEVLRQILLFLETVQTSTMVDLAIENCQLAYSSVDITLQRVSEKLTNLRGRKLRGVRHSEGIKDELREVGQRLDYVIRDLTCSARFWTFEYTPLCTFSKECSNSKCTATRYRWSLQFALSRYGIPFKVNTAVEFITGAGRYSLRPGLSIERVVKYTSPGFETLWRFERGLLTVPEVQEKFRELKRCDPLLNQHIHPGGRNYVQELLRYPGPAGQFELLKFFACELGMTLEHLDQSFLVQCAEWIGEGLHIDLLQAILTYDFDPGSIDAEEFTPDPFFIDHLALLANASPGFAGLTPLHEIVLLDTPTSNFLGQTPLHLAVRDVEIVHLLVQGGHDMDIPDNHAITPLMYAAGMGKTDAAARGQWQVIMDALDTIQATYPTNLFQHFTYDALMRLISRETWLANAWSTYFAKLVGRCSDTNLRFGSSIDGTEDNNLLHFISNHEDAKVLVRHGFKLFNQSNSAGKSAIFSLARVLDATLTKSLLDYGTNVNHVDHQGRTILFPLLGQMNHLNIRTLDVMDSIKICLRAGLDIFLSDGCRCSCSPEGCFLPAAFDINFAEDIWPDAPTFVWALEFLSLVEELRGREDSKRLLLGFIRREYFDRMGITHVCCHRGNSIRDWGFLEPKERMAEDDIDEILDEEEEFVANLEEKMLPLTSETLECFEEQIEALEKRKKQRNYSKRPTDVTYQVDYTNDTFRHVFHTDFDFGVVPVADSMAGYVIWLEHQYFRSKETWDTACEREAWYKRRMRWFVELMQAMEVATKTLAREVNYKTKTT
ncbi:hypothetical protein BDV12DRAFT_210727 [Aspergillus spectabilis]